jgi:DNA-binding LacI/PurR family transcriptional regulator
MTGEMIMRPTIRDVARHAGVSVATVSRYLNDSPLIAPDSVEKVKRSIQALQYEPSFLARNMVSQTSSTVALAVDDSDSETFGNDNFLRIQYGVEHALNKQGYYLMIVNLGNAAREKTLQKLILEKRVDGIIFPAQLMKKNTLHFLLERSFPYIIFGRYAKETSNWLDLDNVMGGRLAAQKLLSTGSKKLCFVGNDYEKVFVRERLEGFKQALSEYGIPEDDAAILELKGDVISGEKLVSETLNRADGYVISDDITAFGALRALKQKNIPVPENVQIVTFDDRITAELSQPTLSVVDIDVYQLGIQAAVMLMAQMQTTTAVSQQCLMPVKLIERGSTR